MAGNVEVQGSRPALPEGQVTFLLTDVEGSTRLWERDPHAAAFALQRHEDLVAAAITAHRGVRPREQGEGDSVVAAFACAADAAAAILDAQQALLAEPWPTGFDVRIRAALHTGPAHIWRDGTYRGSTIIRAARLRELAHGGQTVLSDATHKAVADTLADGGAGARTLGVHRLRDLSRPERVWQLVHPALADDFPPLRSLDASSNNLPAQLTTLIGRESHLAEIAVALADRRVVTLTGPGGVGKSRLAVHAAAEAAESNKDGVWWVDLAPLTDAGLTATALAVTFGMRKEPGRTLLATLADQLRSWEVLIVLDNCEHVLEGVGELVDCLIQSCPGIRLILTSREPLGTPGELVWRVPSLDQASAVDLFLDRAVLARPGFVADKDMLPVIAQIAERLDGLPLALELAAARTRVMHPARIVEALDDRFRLLTGGNRAAVGRQQTLEASVAWSYELLDEPERAVLRCLAVFRGGFTLEAAEAVASDGERVQPYDVLDLLARLIDKSMVQYDGDVEGRYRLLETIRQYAESKLVDSARSADARGRHLDYYLALAERAAPLLTGPQSATWLAAIQRDHENLRAAFDWADDTRSGEHCMRLVTALAMFWELRAHHARGGRWFERALRHDTARSAVRARALWAAAHVALYSDDVTAALQRAKEAEQMAIAVGDIAAAVRARNTACYVMLWFDPVAGRAQLEENIAAAREIGDLWSVGDAMKMRSISWMLQEDWPAAEKALVDLGAIAAETGNDFFAVWHRYGIGHAAARRGDLGTARRELNAALRVADEIGEPATRGLAVISLALLDAATGSFDSAITDLEHFVRRARADGGSLGRPFAHLYLCELYLGCLRIDEAAAACQHIVAQFDRGDALPLFRAWALCVATLVTLATGDSGDDGGPADQVYRARTLAESIGNAHLIALADHVLGAVALRRGDLREARDLHQRALAVRHAGQLAVEVIASLQSLAQVASVGDDHVEASRLLAAASRARAKLGLATSPADRHVCERITNRAASALDDATLAAAQQAGSALSLEEAVAYARRSRGSRRRPASGWDSITPTELQVIQLTAQGLTNPDIAARLLISRATVKTHLAHAFTKLDVSTRAELTHQATRRGIV